MSETFHNFISETYRRFGFVGRSASDLITALTTAGIDSHDARIRYATVLAEYYDPVLLAGLRLLVAERRNPGFEQRLRAALSSGQQSAMDLMLELAEAPSKSKDSIEAVMMECVTPPERFELVCRFIYYAIYSQTQWDAMCVPYTEARQRAYGSFLKNLNAEADVVVSFNWDLLFEMLAAHYGLKIDYCRQFTRTMKVFPQLGVFGRVYLLGKDDLFSTQATTSFEIGDDGIRLLKPHGSVNWLCCRNSACQASTLVLGAPARPGREGLWTFCQACEQRSFGPLFVPPVADKSSFMRGQTAGLWAQVKEASSAADELWVIGYSFPVADAEVASEFSGLRSGRLRKVVVVNPSDTDAARIDACLGHVHKRYASLSEVEW